MSREWMSAITGPVSESQRWPPEVPMLSPPSCTFPTVAQRTVWLSKRTSSRQCDSRKGVIFWPPHHTTDSWPHMTLKSQSHEGQENV